MTTPKNTSPALHPPNDKHLLGWEAEETRQMGFVRDTLTQSVNQQPIWYSGTGHQITFGMTGSGKAVNSAMPQALSYPGSLICFDPKGEITDVTRRYREETLGQQIAVLAPFTAGAGGINPLDLADFVSDSNFDFAGSIATNLAGSGTPSVTSRASTNEAFWVDSAANLLTGVVGAAIEGKLEDRTLNSVVDIFKSDDVPYNLAVLLDTNKPSKPFHMEIASFLQMTDITRSGVLATAQSYLRGLSGPGVKHMLSGSTFDLEGFINGTVPTTIYITIPPEKLVSHAQLVRLLFGSLMTSLFVRKFIPDQKTLIQLDEAAALGTFEPLRMLLTLGRGQGVICHSYWQDLSQIRNNFYDWETILNNHGVIQLLGASNYVQATALANLFGIQSSQLTQHASSEQCLFVDGRFQRSQRLNYLTDKYFAGRFDPNPRYIDPHRTWKCR